MRRIRHVLIAAALVVAPAAADAGEGDKALAESLFQAGKELMKQGKIDQACPKFAESNRIDPSAGTLLNLGKCLEAQGKTASAWAAYKEAITVARGAGQTKRAEAGQQFARDIEPKLSKLRIDADSPPPSLSIRCDGVAVGAAAFGLPVAKDPGEHVIEASAPGFTSWSTKTTLGPNGDQKTVTVPRLERVAEGEPRPPPAATAAPTAEPSPSSGPPAAPPDAGSGNGRRAAGFVVGGFGLAAIGVGAVFGVMTLGEASDAENDKRLCPNKQCTPDGLAKIDDARTKALVSTMGIGVGLAAVAAGALLVVTAPSRSAHRDTDTSRLHLRPAIGPGGAWLTGAF